MSTNAGRKLNVAFQEDSGVHVAEWPGQQGNQSQPGRQGMMDGTYYVHSPRSLDGEAREGLTCAGVYETRGPFRCGYSSDLRRYLIRHTLIESLGGLAGFLGLLLGARYRCFLLIKVLKGG